MALSGWNAIPRGFSFEQNRQKSRAEIVNPGYIYIENIPTVANIGAKLLKRSPATSGAAVL